MIYDIEQKSDLSGSMLVIRFPEEELDKKALYTIEYDLPPFLVPFSYRCVNGMAECTYRLGERTKLQYRFGNHTTAEYIKFWCQVLQPLLDCDDWFLEPFDFILDSRYLYADRHGAVSYLYVPTRQPGQSMESLQALMMELSRQNNVSDPALENKVLRAIMQDFRPNSFLAMLREVQGASHEAPVLTAKGSNEKAEGYRDIHLPERLRPKEDAVPSAEDAHLVKEPAPAAPPMSAGDQDGEIHIRFGGKKAPREKVSKEHKSLFGGKKPPKEKPSKEKAPKEHKPLFGRKETPREILLGAGAEPPVPQAAPAVQGAPPLVYWGDADNTSNETDMADDATCLDGAEAGPAARLRLVGDAGMPREIVVRIGPGEVFTIGRFDVSVGQKQSDFEFEKSTKAVSRRHAAIEREKDGYVVVDLASSAGTFVDGVKLIPNVARPITNGSRISFGTGGADYVWSE